MRKDQTVSEMAEAVLARQARALAGRTGQPFESALEAVAGTDAGRQLEELANGEHGHEKAMDWQANMARKRTEEHQYSWVEGYMEWLEGKEARGVPRAPGGGARPPQRLRPPRRGCKVSTSRRRGARG